MNIKSRLTALEQRRRQVSGRIQVMVYSVFGDLNLANSTCKRTLGANGQLTELVHLGGLVDELTGEELEAFIASFPIEGPT